MKINIEPHKSREGFFVVKPYGAIDFESHQEFQKQLQPLLEKPIKGIVLDLSEVDYISSSGLGSFISVKKALMAKEANLFFCNLRPSIKKLFEILKALPAQNVFESVEEADRYFFNATHGNPSES